MIFHQLKCLPPVNGKSDKISMYQAYLRHNGIKFDISNLPIVNNGKGVGPTSDLIDAFWICELLRKELRLRKGVEVLLGQSPEVIHIFNRTTKKCPENILSSKFIVK
jgi:hypothetical protein